MQHFRLQLNFFWKVPLNQKIPVPSLNQETWNSNQIGFWLPTFRLCLMKCDECSQARQRCVVPAGSDHHHQAREGKERQFRFFLEICDDWEENRTKPVFLPLEGSVTRRGDMWGQTFRAFTCALVTVTIAVRKVWSYLFIYLFIFGCAGSLLLLGLFFSYGARASHCSGFSGCSSQALEHRLSSCGAGA